MATWRVNNSTLLGGEVCSQWQADHAYSLGARCVCTVAYGTTARRGYVYECTTAGTSHATTQPTWPSAGTVSDGTVVWTTRIPNDGNWDNASCRLHYVLNHGPSIASGDTIYVNDDHAEVSTESVTYSITGGGTKNIPRKILCVDKADDSLSYGATIDHQNSGGTQYMRFEGYGYSYGVHYKASANHIYTYSSGHWTIENYPGQKILSIANSKNLGSATSAEYSWEWFGDVEFLGASATISPNQVILWKGGTLIAASGVTNLFSIGTSNASPVTLRNVDLTQLGDNTVVALGSGMSCPFNFHRCKLPSSFTVISDYATWYNSRLTFHNCSSGNTTYGLIEEDYAGVVSHETTIVRTGGASDGTTPISIKMVTSADAAEIYGPTLVSTPISTWTTSAASQTVTVEFVHDSATALQNDEIWLEVEYPADNTTCLGATATSRCAPLGTPADTPDSSATWTTTGLTNPNTRKLTVTIDPGKVGPITARVCLAKASTTCYIDPLITIS